MGRGSRQRGRGGDQGFSASRDAKHCAGVKETPSYFLTGPGTKTRISLVRNRSPMKR